MIWGIYAFILRRMVAIFHSRLDLDGAENDLGVQRWKSPVGFVCRLLCVGPECVSHKSGSVWSSSSIGRCWLPASFSLQYINRFYRWGDGTFGVINFFNPFKMNQDGAESSFTAEICRQRLQGVSGWAPSCDWATWVIFSPVSLFIYISGIA